MKSFEIFNEQHVELDVTLYEEGLRDWFGKSKSKDGKKGWVNVVTGDSCASDKPGEGIPKCVSSEKRSSMSKSERKSAQSAKRREDPGQQSKSGASKPTNVKTDRNVKEDNNWIQKATKDMRDDKPCTGDKYGSKTCPPGSKRYNLAKTFKKMAKEEFVDEACWDSHEQRGMKKKGGKMVPNCVPKGTIKEGDEMKGLTQKGGHKRSTESGAGLTQKGVDAVNRKTGGNLKTAVTTPPSKLDPDSKPAKRRKSFCARSRGWTGERGKAARGRWNC
jgi:hypothetical protein